MYENEILKREILDELKHSESKFRNMLLYSAFICVLLTICINFAFVGVAISRLDKQYNEIDRKLNQITETHEKEQRQNRDYVYNMAGSD